MYLGLDGERALIVASQDVEGDTGDQVDLRVKGDLLCAFALVLIGDGAVQWQLGRSLGGIDRDVEFEVEGQCQADHIEAGANVGGGARGSNDERRHCGRQDPELEVSKMVTIECLSR